MRANPKLRLFTLVCSTALMLSLDAASRSAAAGQCIDFSRDPAGCQPSTFDTPIGDMPSVRIGRTGNKKHAQPDVRMQLQRQEVRAVRQRETLHARDIQFR